MSTTLSRPGPYQQAWDDHAAAVWAYAARRVGRDEADDVVSKVFLVLWRRPELRRKPSRALLIGIAHKTVADSLRSRTRAHHLVQRVAATSTSSTDAIEATVAHDLVDNLSASLSAEDLEVLRLLAWDQLKPREIATVLGISPGAARKRVHDARHRAQRVLRRTDATPSPKTPEVTP